MTRPAPFRTQPRRAPVPPSVPRLEAPPAPPQQPGETALLGELRAMLADLDGHIQRRAEELAATIVRDAEARARLAIVEARGEVQRQQDLAKELGRRIRVADRRQEQVKHHHDRLAALLGLDRFTAWPDIVAAIEVLLAQPAGEVPGA